MRHRVDNIQFHQFISDIRKVHRSVTFRSLATIQGDQMGFFISGDFATVSIGHRFAIQSSFKAFFDKTFVNCSTFLVDTSYAKAMSAFVQPQVRSALSKI